MILAGPCSLSADRDAMFQLACDLKDAGADVFRAKVLVGGTFPPKDEAGWGAGRRGWDIMQEIATKVMPVASECRHEVFPSMYPWVRVWWSPARQFQAYERIREMASACAHPLVADARTLGVAYPPHVFLLKRGMAARLRDVEGMIAHVVERGIPEECQWVVERGVVTYDHDGSWPVDLDAMFVSDLKRKHPAVKVMVDCSHSTGDRQRVPWAARIAKAAGADGLMIEVWPGDPATSPTDPALAVSVQEFAEIAKEWRT